MLQRSPENRFASPEDIAICKAMIREGSRTFYAASVVLPQPVRDPAYALYAFCRMADDTVDQHEATLAAVAILRERLDGVYDGTPSAHAIDRALADLVRDFSLPRALLDALIEGLEWDATGRRYETLEDVYAYGARVAGTVGAMMTVLMGRRDPNVIARACDLGVAMQLTNIARDVGEDARIGRLYLPREWMRDAGIDPDAWLVEPAFDDRLAEVVQRLLDAADALYDCAVRGIAELPLVCRPGIHAARLLYAEIGRELERLGRDSVSMRAVVPARRKAWLLLRALVATVLADDRSHRPCLDEVRFLVEAVATAPLPPGWGVVRPSEGSIDDRVGYVIDLFTRLEQLERPVARS
ncbi:MAG: phytoene/squalene synthase family protein [Geminicoccaceae bacterium]|nr:MAG: phytoene/squalene synthase family protein [Geminicoccaceae bacterium]